MITMKGQYNSANIMIDTIDDTTREQIQEFLNHPAFGNSYIAIMPDCHKGSGSCIGFTMTMNDYILPSIIGVDIGCGMLMGRFPLKTLDLPKFDAFIKRKIPSGFHINSEISPNNLVLPVSEVCYDIGLDPEKSLKALGSLGGGNHFIEAGYDSEGYLVITLHSGSRNFGKCVADFYQHKAKEGLNKYFLGDKYPGLEFLPSDSKDARDYIIAMKVAQQFASENRKIMMGRITEFLDVGASQIIESVHNFIGDDGIIRKGATPANLHQKVIIPFNMKDGIAICTGKGSKKYNYSAPHGAGRILSRTAARKQLSAEAFVKEMKDAGVYTTTANRDTIDEAPGAYKDMDLILENIRETVEVDDLVKPVYNFKNANE